MAADNPFDSDYSELDLIQDEHGSGLVDYESLTRSKKKLKATLFKAAIALGLLFLGVSVVTRRASIEGTRLTPQVLPSETPAQPEVALPEISDLDVQIGVLLDLVGEEADLQYTQSVAARRDYFTNKWIDAASKDGVPMEVSALQDLNYMIAELSQFIGVTSQFTGDASSVSKVRSLVSDVYAITEAIKVLRQSARCRQIADLDAQAQCIQGSSVVPSSIAPSILVQQLSQLRTQLQIERNASYEQQLREAQSQLNEARNDD